MVVLENVQLNFVISCPVSPDQIARISRATGKNWQVVDCYDSPNGLLVLVEITPDGCLTLSSIAEKARLRLKELTSKPDIDANYAKLARKIGILGGILMLLALPGCSVSPRIKVDSVTVAYKDVAVSVALSK